jgi:hypothetical protein
MSRSYRDGWFSGLNRRVEFGLNMPMNVPDGSRCCPVLFLSGASLPGAFAFPLLKARMQPPILQSCLIGRPATQAI